MGLCRNLATATLRGVLCRKKSRNIFFIIDYENSQFEMARIIIPKHYFLLTEQEGGQQNIWLKVMTYGPKTVSMTKS